VVSFASKPFYNVADRVLGSQFLSDIAEFFILFQSMYEGFVTRAKAVQHLVEGPATSFVVVSTLEAAPAREAEFFMELLAERKLHLGALVLNKVLPTFLLDRTASASARQMSADPAAVAAQLGALGDPAVLERVVAEIGENFANYHVVAKREAEQRAEMARLPDAVAAVPTLEDDVADLGGLLAVGEYLWR
jgi:anion-transporting  ArsA/GET3 family ATPase